MHLNYDEVKKQQHTGILWTIEKCFEQNAARMHKIWLDGDFVGSVKKETFHYLIWFLPFRVDRQLCLVEDLLTSTFQRARVFPSKRKIMYYIL